MYKTNTYSRIKSNWYFILRCCFSILVFIFVETVMELKNGFPVALGVIRNAPEISYDEALDNQIADAIGSKPKKSFRELMLGMPNVWEVK